MSTQHAPSVQVDGRAIAQAILARVRERVALLEKTPHLVVVSVGATPATESYLRIKRRAAESAGISFTHTALAADVDHRAVSSAIESALREDLEPRATALVLQLPLPTHIQPDPLLALLLESHDADVLHPQSYARFAHGELGALVPPVAGAVAAVFEHHAISPVKKSVVVVGAGKLVGAPVAEWFRQHAATVTQLDEHTFSTGSHALATADIVVSGTGQAHLIQPDMLKQGVILIDAGTSELNGRVAGDTNPACADIASIYVGVPGGIGPVAVACLMQNVLELQLRNDSSNP